jgi:hypothetical protein
MEFKLWLENSQLRLTAYHCGAKFEKFSTDFSGTGEGMRVLGPGIYFATHENIALLYKKYAKEPYIYEAEIDTTNFYCFGSFWNRNAAQSKIVHDRVEKIGSDLGIDLQKQVGFYANQKGNPPIGNIVHKLGWQKALAVLVENKVQGAAEMIGEGAIELSVYDPSTIHLKSKRPVTDTLGSSRASG